MVNRRKILWQDFVVPSVKMYLQKKEINSINYSIRQLEEKIEYNEKIIESYQDSLDRSRMRAEKCEQELPEMLERYQALCSEIESDYPKMEEFYNSRIYTL